MPARAPTPKSVEKSWYRITNAAAGSDRAKVKIYGEISSWDISAKDFIDELDTITAKAIDLHINSPGGSVFDGFDIYSALKSHSAEIAVHVGGLAASIASIIACAGDTICVAKTGFVMIHNPATFSFGDAAQLRKDADLLDKLRDSIAGVYAARSGKPLDVIKQKMADETWFDGAECKAFGLCDSVSGDDDEDGEATDLAAPAMNLILKFAKLPDRLKRIAASAIAAPPARGSPTPKPPLHTETTMLAITNRDGKSFVTIDSKEHEVGVSVGGQAVNAAPLATNAATAATPDPAAQFEKGRLAEREYAKDFSTCVAAAGLKGKAADEFRDKFYDRHMAIEDVKFFASAALANRTTPVGEDGGAEGNEDAATGAVDAAPGTAAIANGDAQFAQDAKVRWHADAKLRKLHGVQTNNQNDPFYVARMNRYVAAAIKGRADQRGGTALPDDDKSNGDAISNLLKRPGVIVKV